jgi:phage tail-like protein
VNPFPGFNFTVFLPLPPVVAPDTPAAFPSSTIVGFREVTGLDAELEIEEYREGGRNEFAHRFAKYATFPNVVCRRGLTKSMALWAWYETTLHGLARPPRTNVLVVLNDAGHRPVAAWMVIRALPERLLGPELRADVNDVVVEALELSHEGIQRVESLPAPAGLPGGA